MEKLQCSFWNVWDGDKSILHNCFTALFPGPPGWAGARRELLDFMVQGKINRDRHTDHPAGHHTIRTNQCPPPPSLHFLQAGCPSCHPTNSVTNQKSYLHWSVVAFWMTPILVATSNIQKLMPISATVTAKHLYCSVVATSGYVINNHKWLHLRYPSLAKTLVYLVNRMTQQRTAIDH